MQQRTTRARVRSLPLREVPWPGKAWGLLQGPRRSEVGRARGSREAVDDGDRSVAVGHRIRRKPLGSDMDKPKGQGGANDPAMSLFSPGRRPGLRDCLAYLDITSIIKHQGWPRAGARRDEWWALTQPTIPPPRQYGPVLPLGQP